MRDYVKPDRLERMTYEQTIELATAPRLRAGEDPAELHENPVAAARRWLADRGHAPVLRRAARARR